MVKRSIIIFLVLFGLVLSGQSFAEEKKLRIGVVVPVLANEFWQTYADFTKVAAEELGVEVIVMDADSKEDKELGLVENLISTNVDGLVITPITAPVGPILLKKAEAANIPVVFTERWPAIHPDDYTGKMSVGFIGGGHAMAGHNSAKALYEAGMMKIVGLAGAMGNSVADLEVEALEKFLSDHPDMQLLGMQRDAELREDGMKYMENFLSAYPGEIEGVWCFNDETALGAVKALKNAGLAGQIKSVGMDLIEDAMIAIQNDEMLFSSGAHWVEGAFGLIMMYDHLHGVSPTTKVHRLEMLGVTAENVDQFEENYIKNFPPNYNFKKMSRYHNPSFKTEDFTMSLDLPYPK